MFLSLYSSDDEDCNLEQFEKQPPFFSLNSHVNFRSVRLSSREPRQHSLQITTTWTPSIWVSTLQNMTRWNILSVRLMRNNQRVSTPSIRAGDVAVNVVVW